MKTIREKADELTFAFFSRRACIVFVWITVFYSVIIQYKYYQISSGMLILGFLVLAAFLFSHIGEKFDIATELSNESIWMIVFMIYMLPAGMITSPNSGSHTAQWVTSLEYMFMMIVMAAMIMRSGTESFHLMLLLMAIALAIIFIRKPVLYTVDGRYSISREVNPNSMGMNFTTGIWVMLYFQQKKKAPLFVSIAVIVLLGYGVFMTGSRKALIAAGIIVILWLAFCYLPKVMAGKSNWKIIALLISIILFAFLAKEFLKAYAGSDIAMRMQDLERETTTGSRSSMYKIGWDYFLKQPLFGLGFQGFKFYYGLYSHATVIEVPVSGGIIGSILYFVAYIVSLKKCVSVYLYCRKKEELADELAEIKMVIVLWAAMLFYCTCVIHPYLFDSYIIFGIIFGQSSYITQKLQTPQHDLKPVQEHKCKWIR